MAEKAVIIGLFGGLLVSAGVLWAKMPPRPEIHYSSVSQTTTGTAPTRTIPIDRPRPPELPAWAEHHPVSPPQYRQKEVMPSESINNRQQYNSATNNVPETQVRREVMPADPKYQPNPDTRPRQVPIPKRRPVGAVHRPHCICKAVVRRIYVLPQANGGTL